MSAPNTANEVARNADEQIAMLIKQADYFRRQVEQLEKERNELQTRSDQYRVISKNRAFEIEKLTADLENEKAASGKQASELKKTKEELQNEKNASKKQASKLEELMAELKKEKSAREEQRVAYEQLKAQSSDREKTLKKEKVRSKFRTFALKAQLKMEKLRAKARFAGLLNDYLAEVRSKEVAEEDNRKYREFIESL